MLSDAGIIKNVRCDHRKYQASTISCVADFVGPSIAIHISNKESKTRPQR